jgi:hypothetical protein
MKSYVSYLKGLYQAMFLDIAESVPSLRRDCERDVSRLLSLVDSRGLPFFMEDLPDFGKHFDRCLSEGRLTVSHIAGQRPYKKGVVIPRLFKGLLLRVFDDNGVLRADSDVACIRFLRQLYYAAKKMKIQCSDSRTWEHVREFFETDRKVRSPSLDWYGDELRIEQLQYLHFGDTRCSDPAPLLGLCHYGTTNDEESLPDVEHATLDAVQRTADIVASSLGVFDPELWRAKHGPGAVADQRHTQFKYDFPNWPAKLENSFPMSAFGFANYTSWIWFLRSGSRDKLFANHEPPSRLIAVPKTFKGPRLIASEPVAYQWCQQSIMDFLATRLEKTPIAKSIHFRDQTENQNFARQASHTQSHVTVDLSSASDRLSCWVVERAFRRNPTLLIALHSSRTRWVANAIDRKSPQFHKLRKFACMGSACTFPVQSYVFTILAIAATLSSRGVTPTIKSIRAVSQEVRVFGDDIIIPVDGWERLQGLLGHLGLKVNLTKTYANGNFRESCGFDAFDGHDVTPTYTMTYPEVSRPESIASSVSTHNNWIRSGYERAAEFSKSRVDRFRRYVIPIVPIDSGAFGWASYAYEYETPPKSRWNSSLQVMEYHVDQLVSKSTRILPNVESLLLQYFTVARRPIDFLQGDRLGHVGRTATSIRRRWVTSQKLS